MNTHRLDQLPTARGQRGGPCKARPGFTLIELVLNLSVAAIVMGALSSAMLLATHALPSGEGPLPHAIQGYETVEQIAGDLLVATQIIGQTSKSIEFTLADRGKDGCPDTVLYEWSGIAGDPLIHTFNGSSKRQWVGNVHEFKLDFFTSDSAERLLYSQETAANLKDHTLIIDDQVGQYFLPVFPPGTTEWEVTCVRIKAKSHDSSLGISIVRLSRPDEEHLPSKSVLEEVGMVERDLSTCYQWRDFRFNQVSSLKPSEGLCLTLVPKSGDSPPADVQFDNGAGEGLLSSSDGGGSWTVSKSKSLIIQVYGKDTPASISPTEFQRTIVTVGLTLQIGPDSSARVQTMVELLNRPQSSQPSQVSPIEVQIQ